MLENFSVSAQPGELGALRAIHIDIPAPHIDIPPPHVDIPPPHIDIPPPHIDIPPPPHVDIPHIDIHVPHIDLPFIDVPHSDAPHDDVGHDDVGHDDVGHDDVPDSKIGSKTAAERIGTALNRFGVSLAQRDASYAAALNGLAVSLARGDALQQQLVQAVAQLAKGVGESFLHVATATSFAQLEERINDLDARVAHLQTRIEQK